MKLLVVEDELYAREALIRQIKKYDVTHVFEIYQAANGAEGWEICQKEDPELVLTDIRMPGYDGMELLKRARIQNPDMEFIIISGYSHFEYAQTAIRYGVSDYILKPVNEEALNATLQKVRLAYHILDMEPAQAKALAQAIIEAKEKIGFCSCCQIQ